MPDDVRVTTVSTEFEAALIVSLLQGDGIPATYRATDSGASVWQALPSGYDVWVAGDRAADAHALLAAQAEEP